MNLYDLGDLVQVRATFRAPDGQGVLVPTDPTTVTAHVRAPDGSVTAHAGLTAPTREGTGMYRLDLTPAIEGTYWYSFEGAGAVQEVQEAAFAVRPRRTLAALPDLCSPADVQALLQVPAGAADDALMAAIATASAVLRNYTGQTLSLVADDVVILSGAVGGTLGAAPPLGLGGAGAVNWGGESVVFALGAPALWLPELPVVAVTAVLVDGVALADGRWSCDPETGRLVRLGAAYRRGGAWPAGVQNIAVTYTHGRAALPADLANVCARVAARAYLGGKRSALVGPHARESDYAAIYQSESPTDMGGAYGPTSAPILTGHERGVLADYRPYPLGLGG